MHIQPECFKVRFQAVERGAGSPMRIQCPDQMDPESLIAGFFHVFFFRLRLRMSDNQRRTIKRM